MELLIAQSSSGGAGSFLVQLVPIALIILIFWFIVVRPERKKREEHEDFLKSLKVGDRVVTAGGLIGEVQSVDNRIVELQINRDNQVEVLREQIKGPEANFVGDDEEADGEEEDDEETSDSLW
ncbi:MAG: preprotein translocase subunit YajC [Bradymonadaceae bacterium]